MRMNFKCAAAVVLLAWPLSAWAAGWQRVEAASGRTGWAPLSLFTDGTTLYGNRVVKEGEQVVASRDGGRTWTPVGAISAGMGNGYLVFKRFIYQRAWSGSNEGLRRMPLKGGAWQNIEALGKRVDALASAGDALFAASGKQLFRSDDGLHWSKWGEPLPGRQVEALATTTDVIVQVNVEAENGDPEGQSEVYRIAPGEEPVHLEGQSHLCAAKGHIYAQGENQDILDLTPGEGGTYQWRDRGELRACTDLGKEAFLATTRGLYRTGDGLLDPIPAPKGDIYSLASVGGALFAVTQIPGTDQTGMRLWRLVPGPATAFSGHARPEPSGAPEVLGAAWEDRTPADANGSMAMQDGELDLVSEYSARRSLDCGRSWVTMGNGPGLPNPQLEIVRGAHSDLLVVWNSEKISVSDDHGAHWRPATGGLPGEEIKMLKPGPGGIYAVVGDKLFRSTDGATSWKQLLTIPGDNPLPFLYSWGEAMVLSTDKLYRVNGGKLESFHGQTVYAARLGGFDVFEESVQQGLSRKLIVEKEGKRLSSQDLGSDYLGALFWTGTSMMAFGQKFVRSTDGVTWSPLTKVGVQHGVDRAGRCGDELLVSGFQDGSLSLYALSLAAPAAK